MPKETHGGDDTGEAQEEEVKKPKLDKFQLAPDKNIRDIFWAIMASYATARSFKEISAFTEDRFTLMRVAISVLTSPHRNQFGMGPSFVARYSMMMALDGKWSDAFRQFLTEAADAKKNVTPHLVKAIRYLSKKPTYNSRIATYIKEMLRSRKEVSVALRLLVKLKNKKLNTLLEKELIIFARGDVGENQANAITAMETIKEDEDVKKAFIRLLSHWDNNIKLEAAKVLKKMKKDKEVKAAAKKRLKEETEESVKSVLNKIAK